jgi:elongation factor P
MIMASELRNGMVIRLGGAPFKVVFAEYKAGTAKMGGAVHTKLKNIATATYTEQRFHPEERLETAVVETQTYQFLYRAGDDFYFMHPVTFEQIPLGRQMIGPVEKFLTEGIKVRIEFFEDTPVDITFPKTVDLRIKSTGAGVKGEADAAYKPAILENEMEVMVPQFIKTGDLVKIEVETGKYLERVKS